MISSVCLSGIHSAIVIIFLKYSLSIASYVASAADRKLAKFTSVSTSVRRFFGIL